MPHPSFSPCVPARRFPQSANVAKVAGASVLLGGFWLPLSAQTTPAPDEEPLVLSVFEVTSPRDSGYRVQNSVATTGIAQDLRKTPLPITVVTNEFLRDTGRSGFTGALGYTSAISFDTLAADGNTTPGFGTAQPNYTRFRGQPYNGTQRNGLSLNTGFDTENVDRVEIAKGPMAVFVGGATLGGVVNLITKKPLYAPFSEFTVRVGENKRSTVALDTTGPINRVFAYRLITSFDEGETWRDDSYSKTTFLEPQIAWRLGEKYQGRLDGVYRLNEGNLVSYAEMSTRNYQSAYDTPPTELLALGARTALGRPYTVDEYRTRIGQAFGNWRQDVFDATGKWVSLGTGEAFQAGNWPTGYKANHYGPDAPFSYKLNLLESEHTLALFSWLDLRAIGRLVETDREQLYFNFPTRLYPAGNTLLTFGNSRRLFTEAKEAKIEGVLKGEFWSTRHTVLLGYQGSSSTTTAENGAWDATALAPVAGSPNVFGSPAQLTGTQIYQFFDPRVHAYPDHRVAQRWAGDVRPAGVQAFDDTKSNPNAHYGALNSTFWEDRISVTTGIRYSSDYTRTTNLDRNRAVIGAVSDTGRVDTKSYMYGLSVEPLPGYSLYASYNRGETYQPGSLVGVSFSGLPDLTTPAERAAHPAPNSLGTGYEAGLKVELFERKLTGTVGWFQLTRGNILVTDEVRTAQDPRNVGTEVDTNPATTNPGRRAPVTWRKATDGNQTEGVEVDLIWSPTRNYTAVLGASHLYVNKLTVSRPPSSDPVTLRDYSILNGRRLENTPNDTVRLWQRYAFTAGRLEGASIGLGIRYQSSLQPNSFEVPWGTTLPSFTVADLVLGYETQVFGQRTAFTLNINNVTDKLYSEGGRALAAPREFSLTARLRF